MATYSVIIPIAGHVFLTVEASSREEAIENGMEEAKLTHLEEWQCLKEFNQGNVCYCPHPWEAEAELANTAEYE